MNSIIENVHKKSFNFKTIAEVNEYRFQTITQRSNTFNETICDFFRVSKQIKKLLRNVEVDEEVIKNTKELCDKFDNKVFIHVIIDRSFTKLTDSQFLTLSAKHDLFQIKEGKQIN